MTTLIYFVKAAIDANVASVSPSLFAMFGEKKGKAKFVESEGCCRSLPIVIFHEIDLIEFR